MLGSGSDLSSVPDKSIDALWSYDVFVHINEAEVDAYAQEFKMLMTLPPPGILLHQAA